ncbi:putative permease, DMT superfamily [Corynebacterium mustelae]|uniref:Putative permease, DMT superfamily n=2 Tax=Corynebacterium mustelae TaxID=571915 RepID=A0A0G3GUR0_9CORY|nr:putative permease, DMT superfamily [Corynebacterium mustelae]
MVPMKPAPPSRTSSPLTGVLLILGSMFSLQFGAAFATTLFPILGPWATTSIRLSIAGTIVLIITRPSIRTWTRTQWKHVIRFGLAMGLMNTFFYAGLERIPLGTAVTIEFLGPLTLAALLSRSARDYLWVSLAVGGIGLLGIESLLSTTSLDPVGVVFILAAAVFWALYILTSATVGRHVPGAGGLGVAMLIGTVPTLPAGISHIPTFVTDPSLLLIAVGTAVFASLVPYSLEFMALKIVPNHTFGILMSLEPVVAGFMGWVLLSQPISVLGAAAIVLVMVASIGTTTTSSRETTTIAETEIGVDKHESVTPASF